jgi:hypothetical protein
MYSISIECTLLPESVICNGGPHGYVTGDPDTIPEPLGIRALESSKPKGSTI